MKDTLTKTKKFVIESNIPLPPKGSTKGRHYGKYPLYPFKAMVPGDSFLYCIGGTEGQQRSIGNAARNWKNLTRRQDWHFVARQTEEGIRIWRVE